MARLHLNPVTAALVVAWATLTPAARAAATPPQPPQAMAEANDVPDIPDGRRSYAQSAFSKIRPGYNLGGPEQMALPADTRGELGLRRDTLVQQHYRHMAEIDTISDAAVRNHDIATAERAEALRRRDIQRFMRQLQSLRRLLLAQQAEMGP